MQKAVGEREEEEERKKEEKEEERKKEEDSGSPCCRCAESCYVKGRNRKKEMKRKRKK